MKKFLVRTAVVLYCMTGQNLSAQVSVSNDEIPYGISSLFCPLSIMHNSQVQYITYPTSGKDSWGNPVVGATTAKIKMTTVAVGTDLHFSLLYGFLSQDKSRLRIADSYILGFSFGGLAEKHFVDSSNARLPIGDVSKKTDWGVGGGYTIAVGGKICYRISNLLDFGLTYYPLYFDIDAGATVRDNTTGAAIRGYGLHLRTGRIYTDVLEVMSNKKKAGSSPVVKTYNATMRFLYGEKFRFLFLAYKYQRTTGPLQNRTGFPGPYGIDVPHVWSDFQLGWGIMF